jgi:hypothetical protein
LQESTKKEVHFLLKPQLFIRVHKPSSPGIKIFSYHLLSTVLQSHLPPIIQVLKHSSVLPPILFSWLVPFRLLAKCPFLKESLPEFPRQEYNPVSLSLAPGFIHHRPYCSSNKNRRAPPLGNELK